MPDEIEIVEYDPNWLRLFEEERALLERILPADLVLTIEHGGSTAIPGLAAKPIIDIFIAVRSIEAAHTALVAPIEGIGYAYWAENPNKDRMFFVKGMPPCGDGRTHHIHVFEPTSEFFQRALAFRDYLREHPDEAERYHQLKQELAQRHRSDREAYSRAKDAYVLAVIEIARNGNARQEEANASSLDTAPSRRGSRTTSS
jgi:GrpB-like predicted nucleotidyltransferase (UPF0157 family)